MNITENCFKLLRYAIADKRLNAWHFSLIIAVIELALVEQCWVGIRSSRKKIMELSHIKTTPTYHKYYRELQEFGYLKYKPSYHPDCRSTIDLPDLSLLSCTK